MFSVKARRFVFWWCVLSGLVHLTWELGFCLMHERLASPTNPSWMIPWTAYAVADTRYMFSDHFVVSLEWLTVLTVTPMNFYVALTINKAHKLRQAALVLVVFSTMELYGAIMYFLVEHRHGWKHTVPSSFVEFWIKVVFSNSIWLVLPAISLYLGCKALLVTDSAVLAASKDLDQRNAA